MSFEVKEICSVLGEVRHSVSEICINNKVNIDKHLLKSGFTSVFRTEMEEVDFFKQIFSKSEYLDKSDAVIFVNQSLRSQIPGAVTEVFKDLDFDSNTKFFEMSDACTGFVSSMEIANALLKEANIKQVSIILAERYSSYIDFTDTKVSTLFSDSITCCTISKSDKIDIISSNVSNNFKLRNSFMLNNSKIEMNGLSIFDWVTSKVPSHVEKLLKAGEVNKNDIGYWFIHQGSKIVVDSIVSSLKLIPGNYFKAEGYGNLVGGSIPKMLSEFLPMNRESFKSQYIVLLSFGVGLTMKSMLWKIN